MATTVDNIRQLIKNNNQLIEDNNSARKEMSKIVGDDLKAIPMHYIISQMNGINKVISNGEEICSIIEKELDEYGSKVSEEKMFLEEKLRKQKLVIEENKFVLKGMIIVMSNPNLFD